MKRNLASFEGRTFDLIIIGGGITGACLAFDAALRGLSVALLEKNDFGAATSSASSKLLHGGIRYLQQLDFAKVRESAMERVYFQQLAPHLTRYVPFLIPTYASLGKSRLVMTAAMRAYELVCLGQNRVLKDPAKKVPGSSRLSRDEVLRAVPGIAPEGVTGGVVFHESHMHSSERMTLAFIESAARQGAMVANHVEVTSYIGAEQGRVSGVHARDRIDGGEMDIHASIVINAAGPWIPLLNAAVGDKKVEGVVSAYSKGAHIITRPLTRGYALALPTRKQNQAVINRGGRHVFVIPWRGYSLIGTTYGPYEGDLDDVKATEDDIREMMADINSALGSETLRRDDVLHAYAGIYPLIDDVIRPTVYQGTGDYQIVDHAATDDIEGLVSVFGAKYTTARLLAEKSLDLVTSRLGAAPGACGTRHARLVSGDIDDMSAFRQEAHERLDARLPSAIIDELVTNYGRGLDRIIALIDEKPELVEELAPGRLVIAAQVVHAARHEMATHLDDVVFRRTGLGTLGSPGKGVLRNCAELMAGELGWDEQRIADELSRTMAGFPVAG